MSTAKKNLTSCPRKTAVAYARYSSANQRDVSIDQQLQDIRAYAEREGYTIIREYADRAKSGYKNVNRREAFQAMLRAATSGAFDTVLAWKVDRFGRNRKESAIYKGQLADLGVSVAYAMEPIPDGAAGVLTEGMLEAIAEWYSRNLSENVRRGLYDNARKCNANGNKLLGYSIDRDGHYVINETEAALVRYIFRLYSEGNSFHTIERRLKEEGIMTSHGTYYCKASLQYIVENEAYMGVFHFDDIRIPGGMPAIIDPDLWHYCQDLRQRTKRKWEKSHVIYLLSGKCTCGLCNSRIIGGYCTGGSKKNIRYYYYTCINKKRFSACVLPRIKKEKLEKEIFDFLFDHLLTGRMLDAFTDAVVRILDSDYNEPKSACMEKELRSINRKITNINQAIAEGIWTKQTGEMLNELTARAEELKQMIIDQRLNENKTINRDRIRFYLQKIADGKRDDQDYLLTLVSTFINSVTIYDGWVRVVLNAVENVPKIPPEELPPLDALPQINKFDFRPVLPGELSTVEPYPIIVFKIAI